MTARELRTALSAGATCILTAILVGLGLVRIFDANYFMAIWDVVVGVTAYRFHIRLERFEWH
jgi:hypothetical protein